MLGILKGKKMGKEELDGVGLVYYTTKGERFEISSTDLMAHQMMDGGVSQCRRQGAFPARVGCYVCEFSAAAS
jgi:hypothetical protein